MGKNQGSTGAIIQANIQEFGNAKAKQIHAAVLLTMGATLEGRDEDLELIFCLISGCDFPKEKLEELLGAAMADVENGL